MALYVAFKHLCDLKMESQVYQQADNFFSNLETRSQVLLLKQEAQLPILHYL